MTIQEVEKINSWATLVVSRYMTIEEIPEEYKEFVKEKVGTNGIILINFPLFKAYIDPLLPDSSNYWTRLRIRNSDNEILWNSYK